MIKINLAKRKQASYAAGSAGAKTGTLTSLKALGVDSSEMMAVLSKLSVPLGLCVLAYFSYNYYTDQKAEEFQNEVTSVDKEKQKIQGELQKIHGFETQKIELEKTALIINNKINTIEKLILGKDHMVKSMIALSQSLPKDVWLTEINATETVFNIKGNTIDMGLVSDVMSKLGTSIYFKDVSLKGSSTDPSGRQANFELTARRE